MRTFEHLLSIETVSRITCLSKSTIRRRSANPDDDFPAPLKIGKNCVRWHPDEIRYWIDSLPRAVRDDEQSLQV